MSDLSERAVVCKHWRWMDGMRATRDHLPIPRHAVRISQSCSIHRCPNSGGPWVKTDDNGQWKQERDLLPDLTDPATLGCVLALLRAATRVPNAYAFQFTGGQWAVRSTQGGVDDFVRGKWADSEAGALVAALEAAP